MNPLKQTLILNLTSSLQQIFDAAERWLCVVVVWWDHGGIMVGRSVLKIDMT